MRRRFLWALLSIICGNAVAQQQPHYTQYVMNQYIINPAITGIESYTDIKLSHRHQWVGFEGAPITSYFTAHKSFGGSNMKATATGYSSDGAANARGKNYWDQYTAADPHHGIGLQIVNDRMGPLSNLSAQLTYAYHLGLTEQTSISAGVGLGINQMTIDAGKINWQHTVVDPSVYTTGQLGKVRPNISAGVYLYSAKFFLGASMLNVVPQRVEYADSSVKLRQNNVIPHSFLTGGVRLLLGDDFNLIPSVMVKYMSPVPTQVEFNAKLQYRDFLWVGASYRSTDAIAGMLGLSLSNKLMMGYSYDYTASNLNNFSRGSHEFLLGFVIGNGYDDSCPRNVW